MKLMGDSPQERAMSTLIHDHANATALIGNNLRIIERSLQDGDLEEAKQYIINARNALQRSIRALDNYYIKFQNDFQ